MTDKLTHAASVLAHADDARREANATLDEARRSELGQFMTPAPIAAFMASMFERGPKHICLLDAGAGVGSLTAAFVAEMSSRERRPAAIDATAFEVEPAMTTRLHAVLKSCGETARRAGMEFRGSVRDADFIATAVAELEHGLFEKARAPAFDAAILNPPYRKIHSS